MLLSVFAADRLHPARPPWLRWVAWLLAAALVWQLLGATQHSHAPGTHAADCSACFVDSLPPASQPFAPLAPQPGAWTLQQILLPAMAPAGLLPQPLLIPLAHGPPCIPGSC